MGYSHGQIVERWAMRLAGRTNKPNLATSRKGRSRVWVDEFDDVIYSYGRHFPMAVPVFDGKGRLTLVVVNGDRFSNTTSGHQSHVRAAISKHNLPSVIIPFSALTSAEVAPREVRLVHRTDDRWEETQHHSRTIPPTAHWVGSSLYGGRELRLSTARFAPRVYVWDDDEGTFYTWTTRRHWLGESVFRVKRNGRWTYYISGFDRNESRPLYFLAELPSGSKPTTVDEAIECLKPETVKAAEMLGRIPKRQGDIFAIPLDAIDKRTLRKRGARFEKRGQLLGTNHVATETAYLPDGTTLVRGCLYHRPGWRRPDHARTPLGKAWHVVVKNTVPVTA